MSQQTQEIKFEQLSENQREYLLFMSMYGYEHPDMSANTRYALGRRGLIVGRGEYYGTPKLSSLGIAITPAPSVEWMEDQKSKYVQEIRDRHSSIAYEKRMINEAERKCEILRSRLEAKQS